MENSENSPTSGSIAPELINPSPVPEIVMPAGGQPAEAHRSIRYRLTHLFSRGEKLKPHELQKQRDDLKNAASQGTETQNSTSSPISESTLPSQTSGTVVETAAPLPQGLQEIGTTQQGSASNVDSMIQELAEKEHSEASAQEAPPPAPQPKGPISSDTSGAMDAMTARMAQMPDTVASSASQPIEPSNAAAARPDLPPVESSSTPPPVETQPNQNAQIIDFQTAAARVQEAKAVQPGTVSSEVPSVVPPAQTSEVLQPQPLVKAA